MDPKRDFKARVCVEPHSPQEKTFKPGYLWDHMDPKRDFKARVCVRGPHNDDDDLKVLSGARADS
jgi:hypothetical protein